MRFLLPKQHGWPGVLLLHLLVLVPGFSLAGDASSLPAADDVIQRLIERARQVASEENNPRYTYQSREVMEQLKGNGQVVQSEKKIYHVDLIGGYPIHRLIKVEGREMSEEELDRARKAEAAFQERFTSWRMKDLAERKETWLTSNLLSRFEFKVSDRITLSNRATLVLIFQPKSAKLPVENIHDRLLNQLGGKVWVDEQDADVVKVSVGLVETISVGWFGLLGSLSKCKCDIDRVRMPDGVWVVSKQTIEVQLRKLASTRRYRSTEVSSDIKRAQLETAPFARGPESD